MKTAAASLAVVGLLAALAAVPASASARSADPEPVARASGISIGFVTKPLIDRTIRAAKIVRLSYTRYQRLSEGMGELKTFYDYYNARQRAHRFCQIFQAAFGYPRRYYFVGNTVVSYAYDACSRS